VGKEPLRHLGAEHMEEHHRRRLWLAPLLIALLFHSGTRPWADADNPPALILAQVYHRGIDLRRYWVSEKLDGIRAYWNGKRLISRGGHAFSAPDGFTRGFPPTPLDGELWCGRGGFERLSSIVRDGSPNPAAWSDVTYMVFDLPASPARFTARLATLRRMFRTLDAPHIELIPQRRITRHEDLMQRLAEVTAAGGEGLMLHRGDSLYRPGRSRDLLKVKTYEDAEARVIGHLPGKGKYRGMLGALWVETPEGLRFRIGSGFTDAERRSPPVIGSIITYRFNGRTRNGIPRFARFLRVRHTF